MADLFDLAFFDATLRMVSPVLLAALGGLLCERVGIFNVALEGMMLSGAFGAVAGSYFLGSAWLGVLTAIAASLLIGALLAGLSVSLKGNDIVVGISLNLLATGLTTFLLKVVLGATGVFMDPSLQGLPKWLGQSPLVWFSYLAVPAVAVYLFRSVPGLRLRAVGEHGRAAQTLGVDPVRVQYGAILLGSVFTGLAGAQLALGQVTMFQQEMTAGRGFIALVAVIFGRANPWGVLVASLLFGLAESLGMRLQGTGLPPQITALLPFVVTLLALALAGQRKRLVKEALAHE